MRSRLCLQVEKRKEDLTQRKQGAESLAPRRGVWPRLIEGSGDAGLIRVWLANKAWAVRRPIFVFLCFLYRFLRRHDPLEAGIAHFPFDQRSFASKGGQDSAQKIGGTVGIGLAGLAALQ